MHFTLFLAGVFLRNAIPHLVSGLRGETFPTPFAKPRGRGPSSALVNFLWGALNLLIGTILVAQRPIQPSFNFEFATLVGGALTIGIYLSIHFSRLPKEHS